MPNFTLTGTEISDTAVDVLRDTHRARMAGELVQGYDDIIARHFSQRSLDTFVPDPSVVVPHRAEELVRDLHEQYDVAVEMCRPVDASALRARIRTITALFGALPEADA